MGAVSGTSGDAKGLLVAGCAPRSQSELPPLQHKHAGPVTTALIFGHDSGAETFWPHIVVSHCPEAKTLKLRHYCINRYSSCKDRACSSLENVGCSAHPGENAQVCVSSALRMPACRPKRSGVAAVILGQQVCCMCIRRSAPAPTADCRQHDRLQ